MTPSSSADQHAEDESDQRPAAATGATSSSSSSLTHPNPGAWGISDVQDQEFLASYLRDAKANFGHRLQDGEDHHHYHHREAETESEDGWRHRAAASASTSAAAAAAAASSSSLYLQQGLAGFIRTPHLPATWYTAETHEPVKTGPLLERQLSDEDHHQQEEEQKDNGTLLFFLRDNNGKDDENIKDNDRRRDPKVFYSDASRRIEEHLNGGSALLAQHTLDVEADNLDVPYQEPNLGCLSYGSHFCSVQQDYPKAIMKWIDDKFATILSNFSLPSTPELEAGGPLFGADPVPPADDAPCESRRSDLQPSWVQDENTGAWVLVVQTMSLQQWIRLDECMRDPKVFYSDASRRIEEHLNGGSALLAQHTLDVEADNLDVPYQEPNLGCLSYGSHFCSVQQDYPKAIMKWIDDKFATILSNFSLPSTPELEAGGPLFGADPVPPADDAPCESRRSDLQPSWVQDENTGAWVLVVQTMSLQQWIRLDECISKDISCVMHYGKMSSHTSLFWSHVVNHRTLGRNGLYDSKRMNFRGLPTQCHILHQHRNDEYYSDHRRR
ncbi:unnamed protein product [Notodromas monacha]|uniref:Uncharacterized protein n=1 Tax=Notodromas monacha TaxID=399045 RepID=A0A7R9GFM5_9CRUS|nr:unnamed protein product [Notodromas monacha]CAG0919030.1 unnamed protein product [Notodromas monacha]